MSDENTNINSDPWNVTSRGTPDTSREVSVIPAAEGASRSGQEAEEIRSDFGLVSMICGIISLVLGSPWGILGLIFGILSSKGKKHNSQATAGIVCSIVGFVLHFIIFIVIIVIYFRFCMKLVADGDFFL